MSAISGCPQKPKLDETDFSVTRFVDRADAGPGDDAANTDAGDAALENDAGNSDSLDAGQDDAGNDAGGTSDDDAGPSLSVFDCASNQDCPSAYCDYQAPGGICSGCGQCQDDGDHICVLGQCLRFCTPNTSGCGPAMVCTLFIENQDVYHVCSPDSCGANEPCAAPYVCDEQEVPPRCERPQCDFQNGLSCPAPLTCSGVYCVEPDP